VPIHTAIKFEDILRLDVSVNNIHLMQVVRSHGELQNARDLLRITHFDLLLSVLFLLIFTKVVVKATIFSVFCDDIWSAVMVPERSNVLKYEWMIEESAVDYLSHLTHLMF
jgi:hypothetical protein